MLTVLRRFTNTGLDGAAEMSKPASGSDVDKKTHPSTSKRSPSHWKTSVYNWRTLEEAFRPGLVFPSIRLDVIRHGETTLNQKGRVSGSAEASLTERGRHQARDFAKSLEPPYFAAFSSGLRRSKITLAIALAEAEIKVRKHADARLNERSLGELEGRRSRIVPGFSSGDLLFAPPGGEHYLSVTQRCLSFLLDIHRLTKKVPRSRILVCTHMGPMRILKAIASGEGNPQRMMHYSFRNTELLPLTLETVRWPQFLEKVHWENLRELEAGMGTLPTSFFRSMLQNIRRLRRA